MIKVGKDCLIENSQNSSQSLDRYLSLRSLLAGRFKICMKLLLDFQTSLLGKKMLTTTLMENKEKYYNLR